MHWIIFAVVVLALMFSGHGFFASVGLALVGFFLVALGLWVLMAIAAGLTMLIDRDK